MSLTDTTAPLLLDVGTRTYAAPAVISGVHSPANYRAAPVLPGWQFASSDPTNGVLTFEREAAPDIGWHSYSRQGKLLLTGGANAAGNRVYTVFNKEQLLAVCLARVSTASTAPSPVLRGARPMAQSPI